MIIDAQHAIVGRVAGFAAKQALLGETIAVINCKAAVITGTKENIFAAYERKASMGQIRKGPFFIRSPDRLMKRIIRGMLPHHQPKGYAALRRIKCYVTIPANTDTKDAVKVPGSDVNKVKKTKYVTLGEIAQHMGGKA
ncbi:MAG: 50S ribosomal protein L13 [archaeon]